MASQLLNIDSSDTDSPDTDSDLELSDDSQKDEPLTKRTRGSHDWTKSKSFTTANEALDFVKAEKIWRMCGKYDTIAGYKIHYNCKVSSSCSAKVYILLKSESQDADIYQTTPEHDHELKPQRGLSAATKDNQLYSDGVTKPKLILSRLRNCGIEEPTSSALTSYLVRYRRKHCESIIKTIVLF